MQDRTYDRGETSVGFTASDMARLEPAARALDPAARALEPLNRGHNVHQARKLAVQYRHGRAQTVATILHKQLSH